MLIDKKLAIRFRRERYGLSARRIWEHIELRQINPFPISPYGGVIRHESFVDVIAVSGPAINLTGITLADLKNDRCPPLPKPDIDRLLWHARQGAAQRWLQGVRDYLKSVNERRALRNVPREFLPYDVSSPFGISGLRPALESWLLNHRNEKAPAEQWIRRFANLQKNGLRADEVFHSGVRGALEAINRLRIDGADLAKNLEYRDLRLSILPMLEQAGKHTRFVSVRRDAQIKRIKPKLKKGPASHPQWRDRTLGYWIDVLEWDDLLGQQRLWMTFTHRGQPVTSPEQPQGLCDSPEGAMKLADNHAKRLIPRMTAHGKWSDYRLTGGENYREWLVTLPDYRSSYYSEHFDHRNILLHVRCDIREDEHSNRILVLQEVQSDWAQEVERMARQRDQELRSVAGPPWAREWTSLALKLMLLHAARSGLSGLAWTPGSIQVERYGGRGKRKLCQLYDRELPKALNRILKPYHCSCSSLDVYQPVNFRVEPHESGYVVSDENDEHLGTATNWEEVQQLLPDGAHEILTNMHGIALNSDLRREIIENGFYAWGGEIKQ